MLETHYISSPEIESIGYDPEIKELRICMRNGKEKILSNIEIEVYTKLMQSGSKIEFLRNL
ncbi:KTSC domain-containing protein [Leptospira sp. 201903070]|jgi:KTSC domain|uniref:KTSC domain-containing protein n=1 Tax=Leptospira ainlahdjerensis TaxID=2810033 RepID=A0ABS2UG27_9LEPT|nr:KTSC domain-containing protein [Leptospira ainlahdjerensis]MBM9579312.1 KTSC domain-containing protein [Leptospira ainlahdjerensis]